MKRFLFCLILFIFSPIISAEIKLSSVIILESNVPKECGIKIDVIDESILSSIKVTIKKNKVYKNCNFASRPFWEYITQQIQNK